jgi:hypothetical protein
MLDLRKPAGLFFLLLGVVLTAVGAALEYKAPMLEVNINLYFGLFCLAFGGVFLWLARKA